MRFLDRLENFTDKAPTLESVQRLQEKRNAARAARRKKADKHTAKKLAKK